MNSIFKSISLNDLLKKIIYILIIITLLIIIKGDLKININNTFPYDPFDIKIQGNLWGR